MANLITIDQLLESVDLDFEPRFVTKNYCGEITIFDGRPYIGCEEWCGDDTESICFGPINLSEFANKKWQECIYEVPRKDEPKDKIKIGTLYIDKGVTFGDGDDDDVGFALEDYEVPRKTTGKIERLEPLNGLQHNWLDKINELVDAVNELMDDKHPTSKKETQ